MDVYGCLWMSMQHLPEPIGEDVTFSSTWATSLLSVDVQRKRHSVGRKGSELMGLTVFCFFFFDSLTS